MSPGLFHRFVPGLVDVNFLAVVFEDHRLGVGLALTDWDDRGPSWEGDLGEVEVGA